MFIFRNFEPNADFRRFIRLINNKKSLDKRIVRNDNIMILTIETSEYIIYIQGLNVVFYTTPKRQLLGTSMEVVPYIPDEATINKFLVCFNKMNEYYSTPK